MTSTPRGVDVRSSRERIGRSILAPNAEQHHLRPIVELQTKPIPSALVRLKLVREELMIHPRETLHRELFPIDRHRATRNQMRERDVMRGAPRTLRLLAHAID